MENQEEEKVEENINLEALEDALCDDVIEIEEEIIYTFSNDDEEDLDIAFTDNDSRDWY